MAEDQEGKPEKLSGAAYVFYYVVLFFAVWFQAHHFDQNGGGDFHPEDVQRYLAEKGWLGEKKRRNERDKAVLKRMTSAAQRAERREEAEKSEAEKKEAERKEAEREEAEKTEAERAEEAMKEGEEEEEEEEEEKEKKAEEAPQAQTGGDLVVSAVEGEADENRAMIALMSGRVYPYFILFESGAVFCLWLVMGIIKSGQDNTPILETKAGLDSLAEGMTNLRLAGPNCEDYRAQVWRWLSYQFTHISVSHVLMNIVLNFMLGVPLEGKHRWWRVAIMFNVGVLGGALCYFITDAHISVVGCSGGCYALVGIHVADQIMNWRQKKFRLPAIIMILFLVLADALTYAISTDAGSKSHAAQIGGAVAGLIIGVLVCKNSVGKVCGRVLAAVLGVIGVALTAFCLGWMGAQEGGPRNIFEAAAGEPGWCWTRQIWNDTIDEYAWSCVRCGTPPCVSQWNQEQYIKDVYMDTCGAQGWYYDGR